MNKKKMVALLATATMLMGTVPVSASQVTTGSALDTTVSGSGAVVDYDKSPIYKVTLPTGKALDFTIDPYGLLTTTTQAVSDIKAATGTSAIVVATNSGAVIVNESSVPVNVDVKFSITNVASNAATFVTTDAGLAEIENPAIYLTMKPSTANTNTVTGSALSTDAAVAITDNTTATFWLGEAAYEVTGDATNGFKLVIDTDTQNNYKGTAFQLGGSVNQVEGWEEYLDTANTELSIQAVFSYKADESGVTPDIVSGTYALVAGNGPKFASTEVGKFTVTPGTGDGALKEITLAAATFDGVSYDTVLENALVKTVDETTGVITYTVDAGFVANYALEADGDGMKEFSIEYITVNNITVTTTIKVKVK